MENQETTAGQTAGAGAGELVRPVEGRVLAGVAQGLALRYEIPVWLIRLAFILLTFGGGLGIALYAAGWLLIRAEDEAEAPAARVLSDASNAGAWIGIGLVVLAAVILLDNYTFLEGGVIWAVVLLIIGFLLYTGDLPRLVNRAAGSGEEESSPGEGSSDGPSSTTLPTPPRLPEPREQSPLGRLTIGITLLALGLLAVFGNIPGSLIDPRPRHYLALALTVIGVGLLVGAFLGKARWLILVGVLLLPTLLFSSVVLGYGWDRVGFDARVFNRSAAPQSFDQVEAAYAVEVGNLEVDLTDLPWNGESIRIELEVEAGNIEVQLPAGVGVSGTAGVEVGRVSIFGEDRGGIGMPEVSFDHPGDRGHVEIDARAEIGNIEIRRVSG